MAEKKTSQVKFTVTLDDNNVPESINWNTSDVQGEAGECKAVLISLWDKNEQNTLKIDLWTKDMRVEEMKQMFHQTMVEMSYTLQRATNEDKICEDMRDFCDYFAERMGIIAPGNN